VCEFFFGAIFKYLKQRSPFMAILRLWSLLATYLFYFISFLCFRAGVRFSMSQDLFRQIGEKLESLFKKRLHFSLWIKCMASQRIIFLGGAFRHFVKNVFKKEYSVINSFLWKPKKIATIAANNMKGCFSFFILSYFEYPQIWLNIPVDYYHHLSNITKLILKNKF
jgi:hypothetical protein